LTEPLAATGHNENEEIKPQLGRKVPWLCQNLSPPKAAIEEGRKLLSG
jgi:hypothetical protein